MNKSHSLTFAQAMTGISHKNGYVSVDQMWQFASKTKLLGFIDQAVDLYCNQLLQDRDREIKRLTEVIESTAGAERVLFATNSNNA